MGIIINATENAKIIIAGTDVQLESIYGRTRQFSNFSGKSMEVEWNTFMNKDKFKENENNVIFTSLQFGSIGTLPIPENYTGREYLIGLAFLADRLTSAGYMVEIEDEEFSEEELRLINDDPKNV